MSRINQLKQNYFRSGKIEWIGLRTGQGKQILPVKTAKLTLNHGLDGDKAGVRPGGKRQVTLIQAEYIPVMQSLLDNENITPEKLRRNIVVSGLNLSVMRGLKLKVANAIIEITGNCAPCYKMEEALGFGGFNAMRNHGGINAMVIKGGEISIGDDVSVQFENESGEVQQKLI